MKRNFAKYGIFSSTELGGDYLVTAHLLTDTGDRGKPILTYSQAQSVLDSFANKTRYFIRKL